MSCTDGIGEINKQFLSEKGHMQGLEKLVGLQNLRDHVLRTPEKPFRWKLDIDTEMRCKSCTVFQNGLIIGESNATNVEDECVKVVSPSP